jgi:flavin-dependent dehydrogenase
MNTIVVGARLAGLICARVLRERGAEVAVFEASDAPAAEALTSEAVPEGSVRDVCIYYEIDGLAQPPSIRSRLPDNRTQMPGLVFAGEDSSINGSMLSGEKAARAMIA